MNPSQILMLEPAQPKNGKRPTRTRGRIAAGKARTRLEQTLPQPAGKTLSEVIIETLALLDRQAPEERLAKFKQAQQGE